MIVRIMGEGQLRLPDDVMDELNSLDDALSAAVDSDDDAVFRTALIALLDRVRAVGVPLADDSLVPSVLVLPSSDAHVDEVRALLAHDGLIPG